MATPVKCVWIFQSTSGYGWTEIHYLLVNQSPPINLGNILDTMEGPIGTPRAAMLATECSLVGLRASYKTQVGPQQPVIASQSRTVNKPGPAGHPGASQNDSLATVMIDGTQTRKKIIHIRGIWDAIVEGERYNPAASVPPFDKILLKYQTALINNGFGWMGKDPAASVFGVVTGYTQNAQDNVIFQVQVTVGSQPFANLIGPNAAPTYECRISKINRSNSVLNKTFVVAPSTVTGPPVQNFLTTINQVATGPFLANGRFNVTIPLFISYVNAGTASLGERRMGKVLNHYPGRARRRPEI